MAAVIDLYEDEDVVKALRFRMHYKVNRDVLVEASSARTVQKYTALNSLPSIMSVCSDLGYSVSLRRCWEWSHFCKLIIYQNEHLMI